MNGEKETPTHPLSINRLSLLIQSSRHARQEYIDWNKANIQFSVKMKDIWEMVSLSVI